MKMLAVLTALLCTLCIVSQAQDAKYSQYEGAPLMVNPALTGKFSGKARIGVLGSYQSVKPAVLFHATGFADVKLENKTGFWGIGVSYYQNFHPDFALTGKFLAFSLAQHLGSDHDKFTWELSKHQFSLGAQVTLAQGVVDRSRPYYEEGLSGGGFYIKYDSVFKGKTDYADVNTGVCYTYNGDDVTLEAGIGIYHIFGPGNSFDHKGTGYLGRRVDFTGNAIIYLSAYTKLHLTSMTWRETLHWRTSSPRQQEISALLGAMIESSDKINTTFFYGVSTRSVNTILIKAGIGFKNKLRMMTSYECPLNPSYYNVRRSELSLTKTF
ncbi:type IX secretion system membrane protein PorP/SprF [Chitinophagaceae bacterium LB-8]|uniref:Type IX secretion system membrane protein PorP/SprF n=1 Tax=Paraflavisolibacter caeni TaxID=2982496 RepID=A0A9X3BGB5_9BACT|nr:type IX secretion system membrane protein PorP/SprF [Paraflavisolibacter caeni]MCU7547508.1 type IX secretion system membrane protein PorP/SprF [Paraflavisolibacter caeni]